MICKMTNYLQEVSVGVSIFTLTALSYDRYHATANPICHRTNYGEFSQYEQFSWCQCVTPLERFLSLFADRSKLHALLKAGVIWILALLLGCPDLIFSHVNSHKITFNKELNISKTISYCSPLPPSEDLKVVKNDSRWEWCTGEIQCCSV